MDLTDVPAGKRARDSAIRSLADAINAGRSDPVTASDYLYSLVPTGFDTRDMSPGKLGEESIRSLLAVSISLRQALHLFVSH